MSPRPITEDDLNGFVDRRLDPATLAEVTAYLETHPDVARRIAGYCEQRDGLRAALAPIAEEPIPPELDLPRMLEARQRPRPPQRWALAAAAAVLLCVGGAGGWAFRGSGAPPEGIALLAQEAQASYSVYAPDHVHPVELRAGERLELAAWAAQRLGRPVAIPDLAASGYRFMGGRIVPTTHGPAVLFMYDNDRGSRLVMLARPMTIDQNAPMVPQSQGDINGYAWADDGLGYSLVGATAPDTLHPLADEARRQLRHDV
jgi:anti-sigma factor RsiW